MDSFRKNGTELDGPEYDSCINCGIVLVEESSKVSKVLCHKPVACPTNQEAKNDPSLRTEVSLVTAVSIVLNVEEKGEKLFTCRKCGHLLEVAYNAIVNFIKLTKQGSALQNKLKTLQRKCSTSHLPQSSKKSGAVDTDHARKLETGKRPRRLIKSSKNVEKSTRSSTSRATNTIDKSNTNHKCFHCFKSFGSEKILSKHVQMCHCDNNSKQNVSQDGESPERKLHRRRQKCLESSEQTLLDKSLLESSDASLYCCTICNLEFEKVEQFQTHLTVHDEMDDLENIRTEKKTEKGKSRSSLELEDDGAEDDACDFPWEKLKCKLCGEHNFNSIAELREHASKEHPLVTLLKVSDLHNNVENEGKNEVACDADPRIANKNIKLSTSSGRFIYNCNVCNKKFFRPDHIKLHLRIHTGEKPFTCSVQGCGKAFSDPRGLAYHEVTHSNARPYCCKFCGLTFKRLHHLNDHEKNHTDLQRQFVCQFCKKAFKHRKHLNSHSVIHQGTREHQCSFCLKAFNRKDNLRQHMKKVHGNSAEADAKNEENITHRKPNRRKSVNKSSNTDDKQTNHDNIIPSTSTTITPQTIILQTSPGTFATVITSGSDNPPGNIIVPQTTSTTPTTSVAPTKTSFPAAITLSDPTALDQIVYMQM